MSYQIKLLFFFLKINALIIVYCQISDNYYMQINIHTVQCMENDGTVTYFDAKQL